MLASQIRFGLVSVEQPTKPITLVVDGEAKLIEPHIAHALEDLLCKTNLSADALGKIQIVVETQEEKVEVC